MINMKIKYLNERIEHQKEFIEMKEKFFKLIVITGTISLVVLILVNTFAKDLSALDCFSISLITVTMYTHILEHIKTLPSEKIDLILLQDELASYMKLLKEEQEEEENEDID